MVKTKKETVFPVQGPKGMHDILPADQPWWDRVNKIAFDLADYYNFLRIETPIIERAEIYEAGVGETSDIVEKQMFGLVKTGNDRYVLRPEATAAIARAYIEHGLQQLGQPLKLFWAGPLFRHEQPQAGRLRQFHQLDFEIISNDDDPVYDAQTALVGFRILEELKIKNVCVIINTIGCKNCRPAFRRELKEYFGEKKDELCADCVRRLAENPLRILDCKKEKEQELKQSAPIIIDHLCAPCHDHFKTVLEYLDELALPYELDHSLVRGLDYYTKTVFEFMSEGVSFALGGGGRYDYLIELLGGKQTPAVGCAMGVERIIEAMKLQGITISPRTKQRVFLAHIGDLAKRKSLSLVEQLREAHIGVYEALGKDSLKAQLRMADKLGAPLALIFGQKEAFEESVIVRNLKTGAQETIPLKKIGEVVKRKLK